MKRPWVFLTLASVAVGAVVAVRRARSVKSPAILEAQFHHAYDRVREQAAHAAPVLVLFGESLILFDGGRQTQWVATAPATQLIQAAAHMPVGIFALKQDNAEAPLEAATLLRLSAMRSAQLRVRTQLDQLEEPARSDVATLLERSQVFIDHAVVQGHLPDVDISRFASETGPLLLRLIEHATRLELTALHAAADAALAELSADKLQTLEVVVAGVHQARARSLGLQYFQRRFGEEPGEEKRVSYAESAADAAQARELTGTRRLDRAIGKAFFGDAKRLQRDVLGDAASRLLDEAELSRI